MQFHIDNKNDLLSEMIERYYFVKQHQIYIRKFFCIFHLPFCRRFAISKIIVGKISYQATGKCRHIFQHRAFVFFQDLADSISRMFHLLYGFFFASVLVDLPDLKSSVCTGDLHGWLISQEGIAAPYLCLAGTFQKIAVSAGCA